MQKQKVSLKIQICKKYLTYIHILFKINIYKFENLK
ncbi:phosphatase rapF inhibitor PhrF [Bacillus velezensis NAU-B3]|nr:phosphatase rapF inhibitor PhrF [Bacillus velezensis NAU-B3]